MACRLSTSQNVSDLALGHVQGPAGLCQVGLLVGHEEALDSCDVFLGGWGTARRTHWSGLTPTLLKPFNKPLESHVVGDIFGPGGAELQSERSLDFLNVLQFSKLEDHPRNLILGEWRGRKGKRGSFGRFGGSHCVL